MIDDVFIVACVSLAVILVWLWMQKRRLHALLKVFCVYCVLMGVATCQDDTDFITDVRPMVFPEPMMQAEMAIGDLFGNESDHALFMSDGYWPAWLNNSTNLTA
jgi:intracellular septation protein A